MVWSAHARGRTAPPDPHPAGRGLAYGAGWLAFAHLNIALLFLGPWRDPVKNLWVIEFGLMACVLVIPLALVCGHLRGIPWGWRLVNCWFGVGGFVPLWYARKYALNLARLRG